MPIYTTGKHIRKYSDLSWSAFGIFTFLLDQSQKSWYPNELWKHSENRIEVINALEELKEKGYITYDENFSDYINFKEKKRD